MPKQEKIQTLKALHPWNLIHHQTQIIFYTYSIYTFNNNNYINNSNNYSSSSNNNINKNNNNKSNKSLKTNFTINLWRLHPRKTRDIAHGAAWASLQAVVIASGAKCVRRSAESEGHGANFSFVTEIAIGLLSRLTWTAPHVWQIQRPKKSSLICAVHNRYN
uniref:Uncharacterized protein n=1 Tax=Trichogramma kaykai TaxID=54128 RepID=A0ABD2X696_9HYME